MRKYDVLPLPMPKLHLKLLFFLKREKFLCDVVLITTNQEEFPAHRAVLASCSPYFHAMFSCFEESNQNRIVLQDVDPKALGLLLEYVYSSEIQVNEDNVQVCKKKIQFNSIFTHNTTINYLNNRSCYRPQIFCKCLMLKKLVVNFWSPSYIRLIVLEFEHSLISMAA